MPLPRPGKKEEKEAFLSRCMSSLNDKEEFKDNKQRYAVCNAQWDKKKAEALAEDLTGRCSECGEEMDNCCCEDEIEDEEEMDD